MVAIGVTDDGHREVMGRLRASQNRQSAGGSSSRDSKVEACQVFV